MRNFNEKGVSVVEVLIAIGMSTVLLVSIGSAMASTNRLNRAGESRSVATAYAKESIELVTQIKNDSFGCVCAGGSCPANTCTRVSDGQTCTTFSGYGSCWTTFADGLSTGGPLQLDYSGGLHLATGVETITANTNFTREIFITNLQRDANGILVDTGGTVDDNTKQIRVIVSWDEAGVNKSVDVATILTGWQNITP